MSKLCPFCGAYSANACEIEDEDSGIECAWWVDSVADEPDPDLLREQRDDMRRIFGDDRYDEA
jgi:hypothetical protein